MSRTNRKAFIDVGKDEFNIRFIECDESKAKHNLKRWFNSHRKLKPYRKSSQQYKYSLSTEWTGSPSKETGDVFRRKDGWGAKFRIRIGYGARTGVNNANRSFKKGLRQQFKKEIRIELAQ